MSSPKESQSFCQRRKNTSETKENKKSWIDPPEEPKTATLTQAEIESCMQTYEVDLLMFIFSSIIQKQLFWICRWKPYHCFMMFDPTRTRFWTTKKCSSSLATWCSSPLRFHWRPCVLLSTTSSRSAATPWSSAPACRGPLDSGWRTSDSGRSVCFALGKCHKCPSGCIW